MLCFLTSVTLLVRAQGVRKTMLEQLAALKAYVITAERGYHLAEDGLHLIRDFKSGEFNLHRHFFESLRTVDQATANDPSVKKSYELIDAIDNICSQAVSAYAGSGWLQPGEMRYLQEVHQLIEDHNHKDQGKLQVLTRQDALSMTDGQRIGQIREVAMVLQARYSQVRNFLAGVTWLVYQRKKEHAFTGTLKKWYGIQ